LPDEIELRGRRAAVVTVWQRQQGYEVQWYARDDSPLPGPAEALARYARALAAATADPDRTTMQLWHLLQHTSRGTPGAP
ncbi:MAG: hypothetical protein L0Y54_22375, partial [Sporichthyaceae bacterium]|nr:hypothetical protein [Sporichthyaceae bacterium]